MIFAAPSAYPPPPAYVGAFLASEAGESWAVHHQNQTTHCHLGSTSVTFWNKAVSSLFIIICNGVLKWAGSQALLNLYWPSFLEKMWLVARQSRRRNRQASNHTFEIFLGPLFPVFVGACCQDKNGVMKRVQKGRFALLWLMLVGSGHSSKMFEICWWQLRKWVK